MDHAERATLLISLDTIFPSLFEPKVRAQIARARLELEGAVGTNYLSAAQEARVLVRRYRHLCQSQP